jgi:hypothetical protein
VKKVITEYPYKQIRAAYDESTIRVYQAYSDAIADSALKNGNFVSPPFKLERMTWIKPSFLWMMYRSGWGYKDSGQKRILAIDITHDGFLWALKNSCSSHPEPSMSQDEWNQVKRNSPVRIQWDPERDLHLHPLSYRSIQIGLSKDAVKYYISQWIVRIADITPLAHEIYAHIKNKDLDTAQQLLPIETSYCRMLSDEITDSLFS